MEKHVPYNPDGRPPLDPAEKRSEFLKTYVTTEEYDLIKIKCKMAGMSVSDFLRSLALDQEIDTSANPEELKKIRAELGKIGSNINQIAKAVNSGEEFDEKRFKEMAHWLVQTIDNL
jgi:negative regulator of replication initiation